MKILVWHKKYDELMQRSFNRVFKKELYLKTPRCHRLIGLLMIGTGMMNEARENDMIKLMGNKIKIYDKEPWWWIDK